MFHERTRKELKIQGSSCGTVKVKAEKGDIKYHISTMIRDSRQRCLNEIAEEAKIFLLQHNELLYLQFLPPRDRQVPGGVYYE